MLYDLDTLVKHNKQTTKKVDIIVSKKPSNHF